MMKVSNDAVVIRSFMHENFPGLMMIKFSDDLVSNVQNASDAVLLYNRDSVLIGVNLLKVPFQKNGYIALDESLKCFIENRLSSLNIDVVINQQSNVVCGRIKKLEVHPTHPNLHICTVDIGDSDICIVCSAKNVREDMLTVVALANTVLPDGTLISDDIVAGIKSQGMLCSLSEITGGKKPVRGLIELPKDTVCGSILDIAGLGEMLC